MVTIRCTAQLLKKLSFFAPHPDPPASTSVLGEWYGDVVVRRPRHLAIFVNARTLLPVVLYGSPAPGVLLWLGGAVEQVLLDIGVDPRLAAREADMLHVSNIALAKTASRQVLGSMADFIHMLRVHLDAGDSPHEASLRLADAPCGPIGMNKPREVARALFDG